MEAALAVAAVKSVVATVVKMTAEQALKIVEKRRELLEAFPEDIDFIKNELLMMAGAKEDQLMGKGDPRTVRRVSMEEMRDLALDMEDCLDRILRTTEGKEEASVHFAKKLKKLRKQIEEWHQRKHNYNVDGTRPSSATSSTPDLSQSCHPVGFDEPKDEIVELLTGDDVAEGQKVISIVGFGGSGKTTLAKEVYSCDKVVDKFQCRVWVVASKHGDDTKALLTELFGNFFPREQAGEDLEQLRTKISNYLSYKRYLIVLDDIKEERWWNYIESIFSNHTTSRIIVTTRLRTVAHVCSLGNGCIYNMKSLDDKHSKELLTSILKKRSFGLEQSSTSIVNKCDGHPLSLDNVAHYLKSGSEISGGICDDLSRRLGCRVATEAAFLKLREVLMNSYNSLPGDLPKVCFMYICVFPNGCHVKRSRLMRRWSAGHYVEDVPGYTPLEAANEYFKKIVHWSMVSPIDTSKNRQVKSCRAHGIMHEFMLHMSQSAMFITSLDDQNRENYRHLFIKGRLSSSSGRSSNQNQGHSNPTKSRITAMAKKIFPRINTRFPKNKEGNKLRAHSLTICGNSGKTAAEFPNCELLRVLDLEECDDLKDGDIDGIYELWHLKYLSLGPTFSRLPREIEKLNCLETLDVRKTRKVITLPVEVIKLPHLAHLLGKFKLEKKDRMKNKPESYVPKESNLQTLAGFVIDDDPGFPILMVHMKKLQKVKAWCNSDCESILDAIKEFVKTGIDTCADRSLSLYLGQDLTRNFVSSIGSSLDGYLSSLKIHGALGALDRLTLTQFTMSLLGLKVLCLSSTNDLTIDQNDLLNLGGILCLEYLKLVKFSLGGLVIRSLHFQELLCLCLVQSPALPAEVEEGALCNLHSLQLLSEDLRDLSGINIEQHKLLQEVALDSKVNKETKEILELAAKTHPNRPRVLYLDRVEPDNTESTVKYVAAKRPAPEMTGSSSRVVS